VTLPEPAGTLYRLRLCIGNIDLPKEKDELDAALASVEDLEEEAKQVKQEIKQALRAAK